MERISELQFAEQNLKPFRMLEPEERPTFRTPFTKLKEMVYRRIDCRTNESMREIENIWKETFGSEFDKNAALQDFYAKYRAFIAAILNRNMTDIKNLVTLEMSLLAEKTLAALPTFPPHAGFSVALEEALIDAPRIHDAVTQTFGRASRRTVVGVCVRFFAQQRIVANVMGHRVPIGGAATDVKDFVVFMRDVSAPCYAWKIAGTSAPFDAYFADRKAFKQFAADSSDKFLNT